MRAIAWLRQLSSFGRMSRGLPGMKDPSNRSEQQQYNGESRPWVNEKFSGLQELNNSAYNCC